jgi:hypothetical protein
MRRQLLSFSTHLLLGAVFAAGCVDPGGLEDPALYPEADLPVPARWRVAPTELDAAARRRQAEVDRHILEHLYAGYEIVETTQTYSGDLIDWVDPESVPGSQIEAPPPLPAVELPEGVELQPTELDRHPELRGPEGMIPIVRPRFARYVSGESGAESIGDHVAREIASGQPAGQNRLYEGYYRSIPHTGVKSYVNQGLVNSVEPGTFTLLETATVCSGVFPATTLELVGATVAKDMANLNDQTQRLRIEFLSSGLITGNGLGGWDGAVVGFVPYAGRPYGPNVALLPSVLGGVQYESAFVIQNFGGNWWVAHNGNWLGYYPAALFDLIKTQGCQAYFYGEVYDPTPNSWTDTDMGTGLFASAGFGLAAYFRNPAYVFNGVDTLLFGASQLVPADPACYSDSLLLTSPAPWNRYFFLGGPGGNAPGCN